MSKINEWGFTKEEIHERTLSEMRKQEQQLELKRKKIEQMENVETIQIKYFDENVPRLEKLPQGDWIDLCVNEDVELKQFESVMLHLGVAMKLPEGYEAHLAPRSSAFGKKGIILTNGVGVIDNAYCGDNDEWKANVYCTRNETIKKGERLFQFRIMKKQPICEFDEVEHLSSVSRGGYGSTD